MDKADGDDGKIVIKVKTLKGGGENIVSLKVVPNMTIGELKAQIAASALEVPCESQRLVFQGCMLKDDRKTLAEHKLTEGSCILLSVLSPSVSSRGSSASPSIASPASSLPSNPSPNNPTSLPSPVIPSPSSTASPAVIILRAAIAGVRSSNSPEVGTLALQTLSTMLGNIIANPMEEKFRQFKKSNPAFLRRVGSASGTGAILRAAGFQESAQTWVLQPSEQGWGVLCTAKGEIDAAIAALPPSLPPPGPGASGRQPPMAGLGGGLEGGGGGGRGARMDPTMLATLMGMMQSNPALRAQALRLFGASDGPGQARNVEALLNNPALVNQLAQQYETMHSQGQQPHPHVGIPGGTAGLSQGPRPAPPTAQASSTTGGIPPGAGGLDFSALLNQMGGGGGGGGGGGTSGRGFSPPQAEAELTEDELVQQAIERSLRET